MLFFPVDVKYGDPKRAPKSNESPRGAVSNLLLAEIEIISMSLQESAGDESVDSKFRDLHKNTEGANLGNECAVWGSVSAPQFVEEVIAQSRALTFFLSVGGVLFGHRKILCDAVEFMGSCSTVLKKGAVNEEVGIAPYRGSEVRVMGLR